MKALEVEVLEAITTYSYSYSGRARFQLRTQCLTSTIDLMSINVNHPRDTAGLISINVNHTRGEPNLFNNILWRSRSKYSRRLQLIQAILEASPISDLDSMIELSNHIMKALEAIKTYSSLYSGRTRPQLQMQTFNLNFGLKINQLNSYSGRARPTSYRSIIGTSNSIKQN
ncbi:hypothetical protein GIB67_018379, partial [Kingdonia uniflora]